MVHELKRHTKKSWNKRQGRLGSSTHMLVLSYTSACPDPLHFWALRTSCCARSPRRCAQAPGGCMGHSVWFVVVLRGLVGDLWHYDRTMNCLRVLLGLLLMNLCTVTAVCPENVSSVPDIFTFSWDTSMKAPSHGYFLLRDFSDFPHLVAAMRNVYSLRVFIFSFPIGWGSLHHLTS